MSSIISGTSGTGIVPPNSTARVVGKIGLGAAAFAAAAFAAATLGGNAAARATTVSDNFNSYTPGQNLTTDSSNWGGLGPAWTVLANNGVGGSQGISSVGSTSTSSPTGAGAYASAYLQASPLSPVTNLGAGQTISDSVDFNYSINSNPVISGTQILSVGLSVNYAELTAPTTGLDNYYVFANLGVSASSVELSLGSTTYRSGVPDASQISGAAAANSTSEWYQMGFSITNVGSGNYTLGATLYDLGATGTSTPTLLATLTSPGWTTATIPLLTEPSMFGVIKSENNGTYGIVAPSDQWLNGVNADNYSLTYSVPEPAALSLLGVGALGLLLVGRKRRPA